MVGDMPVDIETGKNAKIKTCGVTYGLGTEKELKESSPEILASDIREIINRQLD